MERPSIGFILMDFIILFVCVSLIFVIFSFTGLFFLLELLFFVFFLFISTLAMVSIFRGRKYGWVVLAISLILLLLDLVFIFIISKTIGFSHMSTIFFAIIGIIVCLFSLKFESDETRPVGEDKRRYYSSFESTIDKVEPNDKMKEEIKQESKKEIKEELKHEIKEELKEEQKHVDKKFYPGKYVASRKANKFHSPKCDWAKKINKKNKIWFNSKQEAESQGLEADSCVD